MRVDVCGGPLYEGGDMCGAVGFIRGGVRRYYVGF